MSMQNLYIENLKVMEDSVCKIFFTKHRAMQDNDGHFGGALQDNFDPK